MWKENTAAEGNCRLVDGGVRDSLGGEREKRENVYMHRGILEMKSF